MLLPLVMPHIRHTHFDPHIGVRLEGRTICIWYFGCGFACATTIRYAGFKQSFGTIIIL